MAEHHQMDIDEVIEESEKESTKPRVDRHGNITLPSKWMLLAYRIHERIGKKPDHTLNTTERAAKSLARMLVEEDLRRK